jgi:hypothetical protein
MTSIVEDDLSFLENGRQPTFFGKMEENLHVLAKQKTT